MLYTFPPLHGTLIEKAMKESTSYVSFLYPIDSRLCYQASGRFYFCVCSPGRIFYYTILFSICYVFTDSVKLPPCLCHRFADIVHGFFSGEYLRHSAYHFFGAHRKILRYGTFHHCNCCTLVCFPGNACFGSRPQCRLSA